MVQLRTENFNWCSTTKRARWGLGCLEFKWASWWTAINRARVIWYHSPPTDPSWAKRSAVRRVTCRDTSPTGSTVFGTSSTPSDCPEFMFFDRVSNESVKVICFELNHCKTMLAQHILLHRQALSGLILPKQNKMQMPRIGWRKDKVRSVRLDKAHYLKVLVTEEKPFFQECSIRLRHNHPIHQGALLFVRHWAAQLA